MTDEQRKEYITALIRERAGYAQYGLTGRVAEVDAELALLGAQGGPPAERAVRRGPGRPRKHTEL